MELQIIFRRYWEDIIIYQIVHIQHLSDLTEA